jgi:phosphoglycerate dehydrogenase-like enzyme
VIDPATPRPAIWFERPVLPAFARSVEAACTMLGPGTAEDRYAGIERAVGVLAGALRYDGRVMDRAPRLRVISRTGIGYDAVDVPAATARGIVVCNTPDGPTISTAEHAVTLMLMVAKKVEPSVTALRAGSSIEYYARHDGIELAGKVLGLVGFGRIARRVAAIAEGIGMQIVTFDPYVDAGSIPAATKQAVGLDELLAVSDVVSVHIPLTDASRGLFDRGRFAAMKRGAVFINTARGAIVDQTALLAALEAGQLAGAGLDVTDPEPLPAGNPLLARDDVVVTPHVASATADGKVRMFRAAFDHAMAVVHGKRPDNLVNPEVWDRVATAVAGEQDP